MAADSIHKCDGLERPDLFKTFEVLSVNDCFSLPCQNEGSCLAMDIGFQCECGAGLALVLAEWEHQLVARKVVLTADVSVVGTDP